MYRIGLLSFALLSSFSISFASEEKYNDKIDFHHEEWESRRWIGEIKSVFMDAYDKKTAKSALTLLSSRIIERPGIVAIPDFGRVIDSVGDAQNVLRQEDADAYDLLVGCHESLLKWRMHKYSVLERGEFENTAISVTGDVRRPIVMHKDIVGDDRSKFFKYTCSPASSPKSK